MSTCGMLSCVCRVDCIELYPVESTACPLDCSEPRHERTNEFLLLHTVRSGLLGQLQSTAIVCFQICRRVCLRAHLFIWIIRINCGQRVYFYMTNADMAFTPVKVHANVTSYICLTVYADPST